MKQVLHPDLQRQLIGGTDQRAKGGRKGGLKPEGAGYRYEISLLFIWKWCRLRDSNT